MFYDNGNQLSKQDLERLKGTECPVISNEERDAFLNALEACVNLNEALCGDKESYRIKTGIQVILDKDVKWKK